MKTWKKNLVAAAILVTVCTGIYVNWLYTEQSTAQIVFTDFIFINFNQFPLSCGAHCAKKPAKVIILRDISKSDIMPWQHALDMRP